MCTQRVCPTTLLQGTQCHTLPRTRSRRCASIDASTLCSDGVAFVREKASFTPDYMTQRIQVCKYYDPARSCIPWLVRRRLPRINESSVSSSLYAKVTSVVELDHETQESESYPRLTSYDIHARTSSGVGIVSVLTPMILYLTVPEIMSGSTIAVYSVVNSIPNTYIRLSPRIKKTTSTQLSIAVNLTELSAKTKAMYKIDIHIQGISQSTEWFRTITKLDKIRYPHFHGALTLASLAFHPIAHEASSAECE